jgi:DNA mismatch repair ATPase MutS
LAVTDSGVNLAIDGLRPYWMAPSSNNDCVTNTVRISDELLVLTGPNMSGKSTLLRSLTAAAILAHAGLPIPAKTAAVPRVRSQYCT